MAIDRRAELQRIRTFPALITYLRDELGWPIESDDFEELTFDYTADELGIDSASAAKIQEIKRLRPLAQSQPWGIFFVKFEPKQLPVVALRRILSRVVLKKRASANSDDRAAWAADDLLFVSNFGRTDARQISFAHFSQDMSRVALPVLKVLGWDNQDTQLHLDHVVDTLHDHLLWPDDPADTDAWRANWRGAFTLRHREVVTTSKSLAVRLAELARSIRDRIAAALAIESEDGPLKTLMITFRQALVHDLDADAFADMYAQTIAYGLLSARIADPKAGTVDDLAGHMRTSPFLRELMETFLSTDRSTNSDSPRTAVDFDELGINEVVDLLDDANMEAVLRDFGNRNPQEDPVIHFYELFLKEYDERQRIQRGVFYTPRPIVSYIVRSVDIVLRKQFGLVDGLADDATWGQVAERLTGLELPSGVAPDDRFVTILDPATGTGTFLVEAIDVIHSTLVAKWRNQGHGPTEVQRLWNEYVPSQLLPRLHGYELLMAPYAIAHLKIGLKLFETGYRFASEERARVYLTNALEPASVFSGQFAFAIPALAHEAQAVNEVKRNQRFTVVIGNPPYSKISSNLTPEMRAIVERYRYVDGEKIKERGALQFEINLQDDYVKFCRLCEERLSGSTAGVLGLITNNGYLSTPTLRGMRDSLLETFGSLWVVDLHGHLAKGEIGPDGTQEENVFDILQGVSLLLGCRALPTCGDAVVWHAERYGSRGGKYDFLQGSTLGSTEFAAISPSAPFFLFVPHDADLASEWQHFAALGDVFPRNSAGIITARDALVIGHNAQDLAKRLERFSKADGPAAEVYEEFGFSPSKRFDLRAAQAELQQLNSFTAPIRGMLHRPFDERFVFFHPSVVWSLSRPMANQMVSGNNLALVATRQVTRPQFEHAFVARHMIEIKACSHDRNTQIFPLFVQGSSDGLFASDAVAANLGPQFLVDLSEKTGLRLRTTTRDRGSSGELTPRKVLDYVYGILYAPSYRGRYFEFLRSDFPRIPTPATAELFLALARLGGELIDLHLLDASELDHAGPRLVGPRNPEVGRVRWSEDTVWVDAPASARGQQPASGSAGFRGVPEAVWRFRIGGYQVCEKWLKDRKGRRLTDEEVARYTRIVAALSATPRIMDEIDGVIEQHGGWPEAFGTS